MYRYWFIAFAALLLTACTAVTDEVRATVEYAFKDAEDAEMSPQKMKEFPYTSLYAQWQGDARALIVLGFVNKPNDWHFITSEKETLVLQNGRVVRTQGLKDNLLGTSNLENDPLKCLITQPADCKTQWQRNYDYKIKGKTISRSVRSEFTVHSQSPIEMPFGQVSATLVEESGTFLLTGETFINKFWLEDDGHVVKSEQHVFPDSPQLTLTQVTWIGRDYTDATTEQTPE
ncbi:YjbF family lipoprotein [Idiomarina aminovorans]|uniref:YjbF family lipoprotein n=1 Tax=Idiomarina aminovorans TaxID=2914829 RepID=UPI002005F995|nr:YjbF family lipoprotein [Idiomarina sp. ATCH4]MCK7459146.1 YjbF family lipoprotein [Idiomarina sp. ATCH4]